MEKGFLFDRIRMNGTGISINKAVMFPLPVFANPANTSFPLCHAAPVGTKFTLNFASLQRGEIRRKFSLDKSLLSCLGMGGFRETEEINSGECAKARSAKPQELPFCHW
jgi:hypothetical protein